jgi:hypothetical protein
MSITNQFLLAVQAYQEIQAELHPDEDLRSIEPEIPASKSFNDRGTEYPDGSLLLGLADDGYPLLLDLYDPAHGPLLVAGDGGSGKTAFLQSLVRASDLQNPGEIQFGVLTLFPEEWTGQETLPNCLGIWPAYHPAAHTFLSHLVSWAEDLPDNRQVMLILFDGLDLLAASGFQIRHNLRWLLMHGPQRQIWPVVTVNPGRLNRLETWLDYFHTRILGHVNRSQTARLLVNDPKIDLAALLPGQQFGLLHPEGWQRFWLPPI